MNLKKNLKIIFYIIGLLWIIFFLDLLLPFHFKQFGIIPGNIRSLPGIFISPFLHADLNHLVFNSIALAILLFLSLFYDKKKVGLSLLIIIVCGGLGTWVFGSRGTVHVGASGVIFGLIGWLLFSGIFKRDIKSILFALLVFFLYGGTLLSFFRVSRGISWSAHFFGFLSGVLSARIMSYHKNLK